jgi:hypothetical protein
MKGEDFLAEASWINCKRRKRGLLMATHLYGPVPLTQSFGSTEDGLASLPIQGNSGDSEYRCGPCADGLRRIRNESGSRRVGFAGRMPRCECLDRHSPTLDSRATFGPQHSSFPGPMPEKFAERVRMILPKSTCLSAASKDHRLNRTAVRNLRQTAACLRAG